MATRTGAYTFRGTSSEAKPTDVAIDAVFWELDTGKKFFWDGSAWTEIPGSGGSNPDESDIVGTGKADYMKLAS